MRRRHKIAWIISPILALIIVLMIGLGLYDVMEIRPKLPAINAILQNASPQDRNPPVLIKRLININEPRIDYLAIQALMKDFYPHGSQSKQHLHQVLWHILLPVHFKQDELYGIFATTAQMQAYYEKPQAQKGLNNFALRRFGKPLDQLTLTQSATVVAMSHSPTSYQKDSKRLEMRVNFLLDKLQNQQNNQQN